LPSNTLGNEVIHNNNNINANAISSCDLNSGTPKERKVIIQKIENVKLETINFNGPPRRVSTLFEPKHTCAKKTHDEIVSNNNVTASIEPVTPTKILSAKMPENSFNTIVPLKMIRTIRPPKPVPNFTKKRFVTIQMSKPNLEINNDIPVSNNSNTCEIEKVIEEVTVAQSNEKEDTVKSEEDFCGFEKEVCKEDLFKKALRRWSTCLTQDVENKNEAFVEEPVAKIKLEEDPVIQLPSESQKIAENCTAKNEHEEKKKSTIFMNEAPWLNDIIDLIGESRIKEIDASLKEIPNIVTGNNIEAENVELKLIINYLLRQLNVPSITEVLSLKTPKFNDDSKGK
jgi:hypothetical protein